MLALQVAIEVQHEGLHASTLPRPIRCQGSAGRTFIIPGTVRRLRVIEVPYDPRQGDAAIVGSAYFDLGVATRGYQLKGSYGSFDQARVVAIAAPLRIGNATFGVAIAGPMQRMADKEAALAKKLLRSIKPLETSVHADA